MRQSSRHRLAGPVLALAALVGGLLLLPIRAQPPGPGTPPPWAAPPPGAGGPEAPAAGLVPAPGAPPGLPTSPPASSAGLRRQGDLLRLSRNVPGDAKPVV